MSGAGRPESGDTIVAVATPPGRGALGTVRLSGPGVRRLIPRLFRPWRADPGFPPARLAVSGTALDLAGAAAPPADPPAGPGTGAHRPELAVQEVPLDHGVLVFFPAASSPTGEDLAEITLHGSPPVLARFLESAVAAGARLALPGEFSYRAFLAGRLDAAQAEAVDDLIRARTAHQARVAHQQQTGALARAVEPARVLLVEWLARLEGSIEFSATESEDFLSQAELNAAMASAEADLSRLLAAADAGMTLARGARVVLAGPVNAGKSSLLNALLGRERAIVSAAPGTTRDYIEAEVEWDGLPVTLVDTAGEGLPLDPVEAEGQRRGADERAGADLVIWLADASAATAAALAGPPPSPPPGAPPMLPALNKIDLLAPEDAAAEIPAAPDPGGSQVGGGPEAGWLPISARTGAGLDELRRRALALLAPGWDRAQPPLVSRLRQKTCLQEARDAVAGARRQAGAGAGEEIVAVHLGQALAALAALTGRGDLEEVYDRIFSTFCIGK